MPKIDIKVQNLERLAKQAQLMSIRVADGATKTAIKGAAMVASQAKRNLTENRSVDSGRLRASVHAVGVGVGRAKAYTPVDYAPYVEFGTGVKGSQTATGKGDLSFTLEKAGRVAKPFLHPAFRDKRAEVAQLFAQNTSKNIRSR